MNKMEQKRRKPNRLHGFDYSRCGAYFITICVKDNRCVLSEICASDVGVGALDDPYEIFTRYGEIVEDEIQKMNEIYPHIQVNEYIIMPNHIHFILFIRNDGSSRAPTPTNALVPRYISTLKRMTNKKTGKALWQRSYYDHIIRDENDYIMHLQYIRENPRKWLMGKDEYYV